MTVPLDARESGNDLLHALAATFPSDLGVKPGRMFNGQGLRVDGLFFAFVSSTGRLVVKLSEASVGRLVAEGEAEPVTMGTRTMREWASLPQPQDGDLDRWRGALHDARAFVDPCE